MYYPDNPDPIRKRNNIDLADILLEARFRRQHGRSTLGRWGEAAFIFLGLGWIAFMIWFFWRA